MVVKQDQTDEQILDKVGVEIELAGLRIEVTQPNRRNRRKIYARVIKVWQENEGLNLVEVIDKMLDCLYECFPVIAKQRQKIDSNATENEINKAFREVAEWLGNPIESSLRETIAEATNE